jgi:gliding motility-associated-like protein
MMNGMKNAPDAFERALRESLDSYEVPYNSADWSQMERELDKVTGVKRGTSAAMLALLMSGGLALATTAYLLVMQPGSDGSEPLTGTESAAAIGVSETETLRTDAVEPVMQPSASSGSAGMSPIEVQASVNPQAAGGKPSSKAADRSANAAPVTSSAVIATSSSLEVGIKPSVTETCPGNEVVFAVENAPDPSEVKGLLWNFGDGSFSVERMPTHIFTKPGRYEVTLSYSTSKGSLIQKPVSDPIIIHEVPKASFVNLAMGGAPEKVPYMHFEPKSPGAVSYLWDFGDGQTSKDRVATHVYKKKGTYSVNLIVENAIGCSDRAERTIKIDDDYNLLAPTAFSPNGDGVDDSFMPDALTMLNLRFHMRIHDPENGQLLFETNDPKRSWNGRIGGRGEACPVGNYLWVVEMKDGEKVGGTYNGTVSLVR